MNGEPGSGSPEPGEFDDFWRHLLQDPGASRRLSRFYRKLPAPPRCKACGAPFAGPLAPALRVLGVKPWPVNQQLCNPCYHGIGKMRGGAEVPVSLLYTDVRDSTALAEQRTPTEFRTLLDRFFKSVFKAVDSENGVIDHIVGDGVMAMWVPAWAGQEHARRAVAAGRKLAAAVANNAGSRPLPPAGVGVHTGNAWVGVVGETGMHDFTVVGDAANTTARLGSSADQGELVISNEIVEAAEVDTLGMARKVIEVKGKSDPIEIWVEDFRGRVRA